MNLLRLFLIACIGLLSGVLNALPAEIQTVTAGTELTWDYSGVKVRVIEFEIVEPVNFSL